MMLRYCMLVAMAWMAFLPGLVYADPVGPMDAFVQAVDYDAKLGAAEAENAMYQEEIGKARAALRPYIGLRGVRGRNATTSTVPYYDREYTTDQYYNMYNYSLSLRQTVFNIGSLTGYQQAKVIAAKSDDLLEKERSALIVRLVEVYCDVLYQIDVIKYSEAYEKEAEAQLKQAELRKEKGFGSLTEISEAQAAFDMATADKIEGMHKLDLARSELQAIAGCDPYSLKPLNPEALELKPPSPDTLSVWIDRALDDGHGVKAARKEVRAAGKEIAKKRAERYPVIDVVASRTYSQSDSNYDIGNTYDTYSISLQASLPIYTGGYVSAEVRQSIAKRNMAMEQLDDQERTAVTEVQRYFNGMISSIGRVKAYAQAVSSNEIALKGTRKGFEVGLRTNIDVLMAQRRLYDSRRSLSRARFDYIISMLKLEDIAGTLTESDLVVVNKWFN